MPIIRGELDFEEQFTRIPNRWVRDARLSLKAIGLLAQLLSHAPGWKVSLASLARANDCGLDLIRGAISELEEAGYLVRKQDRDVNNRFGEAIYITADPSPVFPLSAFPTSDNPTPKKTITKEEQDKEFIYAQKFEEFWKIYPRRVGRNSALRAFKRVLTGFGSEVESKVEELLSGASRLSRDPNLPPAQFIPYPATWLNREGWLDEPYPERVLIGEEKRLADLEASKARRERELEISRLERIESEKRKAEATPAPTCEHGSTIVRCRICLTKIAKNKKTE
jgi:hypothetical protein